MRSQKQVRRIAKVRSVKNAAAGKWKTYRKSREARKAWQNNTVMTNCHHSRNLLAPPPLKRRQKKEPKQRSPEQLAERQRLREQKRMAKELAKQRASTSALLGNKKEKKFEKISANGPKKAPAEQKSAPKATKTNDLTTKKATKPKLLVNEQVQHAVNLAKKEEAPKKVNKLKENESKSKQQHVKGAKSTSIEGQKINHASSPVELEQEELVQSTKRNVVANKTGKKSLEKEVIKKEKNGEVQLSDSTRAASKKIKQDHAVDSNVVSSAKIGTGHDSSKEQTPVKEKEPVQLKQAANKKDQVVVQESREQVEQKNKRKQRSDSDSLSSQHDFVKGGAHEMDYQEAKEDLVERADEKRRGHGKQQSKSVKISGKDRNANDMIVEEANFAVASKDQKAKQDHLMESCIVNSAKVGTAHDSSKEKTPVKEKEIVQLEQGGMHEMDHEEAEEDFMKGTGRRQIEKRKDHGKQQSKAVKISGKDRNANDMIAGETDFVVTSKEQDIKSCAKETKHGANLEKKDPVFVLPQMPDLNHIAPQVRERVYKLLPRDVDYCIRMIEKHGDDYEAMAKDRGNIFGDSAKGIARKIRVFKESPQYEEYLKTKS